MIDSIAITCCVNFSARKRQKIWANKIFLITVYMIFKYGKHFRFAPLFNKASALIKFIMKYTLHCVSFT